MADKPTLAQKMISAITGMPAATRTESGFRKRMDTPNRRRYRRIQAPVYCRPAGLNVFSKHDDRPIDVSLGGVRVYSDEVVEVGARLTLELFLEGQPGLSFDAEVAWVEELAAGEPGKYDVGLKFVHLSPENEALLAKVLE